MTIYSDIKNELDISTETGIVVLEDVASVQQALKLLIKTRKQSLTRFELPYFGSNLYRYLMEKISPLRATLIEDEIITAVENYEPRVQILTVTVEPKPDDHLYEIYVLKLIMF